MCVKQSCTAAGISTKKKKKHSLYFNIISQCKWTHAVSLPWDVDRIELRGSKLHLWLSSIKLETQGTPGTQSLSFFSSSPFSLYLRLSLLSVIMKCAITVTWKRKRQSDSRDERERERGNWLGCRFPRDRRNWQFWSRPWESHLVRQRNLKRLKVKTG